MDCKNSVRNKHSDLVGEVRKSIRAEAWSRTHFGVNLTSYQMKHFELDTATHK